MKDISEVSSEQVLILSQRVVTQRVQKVVLDNIRAAKEFD